MHQVQINYFIIRHIRLFRNSSTVRRENERATVWLSYILIQCQKCEFICEKKSRGTMRDASKKNIKLNFNSSHFSGNALAIIVKFNLIFLSLGAALLSVYCPLYAHK